MWRQRGSAPAEAGSAPMLDVRRIRRHFDFPAVGRVVTNNAASTQPPRELIELYRSFYAGSPFVRVVGHLPATKDSAYTNFFDVTLRIVRGKVVILACLDNLIKGAAGVAVQNFNLMTGHPETTALI